MSTIWSDRLAAGDELRNSTGANRCNFGCAKAYSNNTGVVTLSMCAAEILKRKIHGHSETSRLSIKSCVETMSIIGALHSARLLQLIKQILTGGRAINTETNDELAVTRVRRLDVAVTDVMYLLSNSCNFLRRILKITSSFN